MPTAGTNRQIRELDGCNERSVRFVTAILVSLTGERTVSISMKDKCWTLLLASTLLQGQVDVSQLPIERMNELIKYCMVWLCHVQSNMFYFTVERLGPCSLS